MEEERKFRLIATLKAGKSIVSTLNETLCFNIYNEWVKYNKEKIDLNKKIESMNKKGTKATKEELAALLADLEKTKAELESFDKVIIEKKANNKIVEVTAILVSDIVALQINEVA